MLGIRKLIYVILAEVTFKSHLQQAKSGHSVWDGRKFTKRHCRIVDVTKLCKDRKYDFAVLRLLNPQMPESHVSNVTFTERHI